METTDHGLPKQLFFTISEIYATGLMSKEKTKLLLYEGKLKGLKNGRNWRVPRAELIRFINENMAVA